MHSSKWRRIAFLVVVTSVSAGAACGQMPREPAAVATDIAARGTRVPGEYLVTLVDGADVKAIADLYGRFGIKATRSFGRNVFLVTLTEDPGPARMEELREQNAQVGAVQPNFLYRSNRRRSIQ